MIGCSLRSGGYVMLLTKPVSLCLAIWSNQFHKSQFLLNLHFLLNIIRAHREDQNVSYVPHLYASDVLYGFCCSNNGTPLAFILRTTATGSL